MLFDAANHLAQLAENKGQVTGLSTGFVDLDKLTSGLQPSDFIILAARPSMGKTAFSLNLVQNVDSALHFLQELPLQSPLLYFQLNRDFYLRKTRISEKYKLTRKELLFS